ncbi:DHH family phosphoesterase [Geoalkalibacter halelectricus]|uniref:DHH family phosphoesterase n=1 Tax=Geoalkalibacter halelectricus TaxID=2847045 RepID=A0ABY5ZT06_9BACT|nr:DHH family phosphoesterase [Geoalkalibacter halelectricus]MDO3379284.1 DHH family phosphoesterase [Geoalkalibacter halelectricus]UWZ81040.1 DHH family phosphoesterase [Geoalkalibacter halelectricus]
MPLDLTRSREFSAKVIDWIRGKGRVLIMAHDNPDPDSLAAATALRHLLQVTLGIEATVAFGGIIGRGENRQMVKELEIKAFPIHTLDLNQFNVVCMVDTQPGTGNNSFPADRPVHLVIDHHPPRATCDACPWVDIREDYGASATILYEYLVAQKVSIGTKLATILFYAIKSETQDLGREWCRADREAYLQLLPLVNNRILFNITQSKVPREYFSAFNKAISTAVIYDGVLVFNLFDIHHPDIVAEMADFLMRTEGIDVVLGMGCYNGDAVLSFRTLSHEIYAGEVMRAVVEGLGTAGGHGMIAGGQVPGLAKGRQVQEQLAHTLTRRLLERLGRSLDAPVPLLSPSEEDAADS